MTSWGCLPFRNSHQFKLVKNEFDHRLHKSLYYTIIQRWLNKKTSGKHEPIIVSFRGPVENNVEVTQTTQKKLAAK